jgi:hypothetical protein
MTSFDRAQDDREPMIVPGNNRRMQVRRRERRKLFGKARKERFLEHLSCTANVAASAEAAGVTEGCVYTHRRTDPEFRDAFWIALEQGVAKLVALRIQRELERAKRAEAKGTAEGGQSASDCPSLELRLDGPPDEKQIVDLIKLMQMLRDLCRNLSGGVKPGRPQIADVDTVCAALAKRLKAFPPLPPFEIGEAEAEAALRLPAPGSRSGQAWREGPEDEGEDGDSHQ